MPNGGHVTIANGSFDLSTPDPAYPGLVPGAYTTLRVEDTGHGMTAATLARIFEPFFTTKPIGRGTGLGLSTVMTIVRGAGGHIAATSKLARGTAFVAYLPRAESPVASANSSE